MPLSHRHLQEKSRLAPDRQWGVALRNGLLY